MVMRTTDAERSRLFDEARTKDEVDQLHLRFQQEDEQVERERRFPMTVKARAPAPDEALIAGIADVIAQRDKRIASLERKVEAMRQKLDAVERIKSVGADLEQKMSTRDAQLSRISEQLDALLQPSPVARRAASARLRQ